jgi:hypothetical protein
MKKYVELNDYQTEGFILNSGNKQYRGVEQW